MLSWTLLSRIGLVSVRQVEVCEASMAASNFNFERASVKLRPMTKTAQDWGRVQPERTGGWKAKKPGKAETCVCFTFAFDRLTYTVD